MLSCIFILKPFKNANATDRQGNARIRRAIIEVDGVAISGNGVSASKDDVVHIPEPLVEFFWTNEPFVAAFQAQLFISKCSKQYQEAFRYPQYSKLFLGLLAASFEQLLLRVLLA